MMPGRTEKENKMTNTEKNDQPKQKPVGKVHYGRVKAAIWRKGTDKTWHEVSFQRGFKRKDGSYGNSHSFDLQSALALRAALDEAIPLLRNLDAEARVPAPGPEEIDDNGPYIDDDGHFADPS
jgi:hypothetical protein